MPNNVIARLLLAISVFFFCQFLLRVDVVLASSLLYEDFNTNNLDSSKWTVLNETDKQILTGDYVNILNIDSNRAVFLQNNIPFETNDDIQFKVRFKYNSMGFGSGIALNDNSGYC